MRAILRTPNLYATDHVDVWVKFAYDGLDLRLEQVGALIPDDADEVPEWFRDAISDTGIDGLMVARGVSRDTSPEGWETYGSGYYEALELGVAPNQAFLVRVWETEHSKTWTDCGYEYDANNDVEHLGCEAWPAERSVRAWQRFLRERRECLWEREHRREKLHLRAQRAAPGQRGEGLYLQSDRYWSRGYYDGGSAPDGEILRLIWKGKHAYDWLILAEGRSDRGDMEEVFRNLWAACVRLPHLAITRDQLAKLPHWWR